MTCSKCGAAVPEGAAFCPICGHPAVSFTPPARDQPQAEAARRVAYAGFWLRFMAYLLDTILLSLVLGPFMRLLFLRAGLVDPSTGKFIAMEELTRRPAQVFAVEMIVFVVVGVYFSILESSPWQATLGKKAFGLIVTDRSGRRLSFGRSTARYFAKIASNFSFGVGYVMAGFTERKQALHDLVTDCLVLRKKP